ncbi:hypothetical protein M0R45_026475 [Rubus argutus]|uniref:Fe2OG dioxygenase domain-containing protein n=1 Tax=Rubus argutus TaxID=59490 RepID=A0AAW1WZD8_RUBAR
MAEALKLPIIDLSASDVISSANSIRQACIECGFFYLVNHGVEEELLDQVFEESSKFFSLPLEDKSKLVNKLHRGYTPLLVENLDPNSSSTGDSKEGFCIGPFDNVTQSSLNQWPSEDILPSWRRTMESYYRKLHFAGKRLISLIALALDLDEDFFEKVETRPTPFLCLLHYPGQLGSSDKEIYGAAAHSDFGIATLLASNGVPGLQVCREKSKQPQVWEDVLHVNGSFVVNLGNVMERLTNCLFRSTLHRVRPAGRERYSVAFFLNPNEEFMVECLAGFCNESSPARFPPIRGGDYLKEHIAS